MNEWSPMTFGQTLDKIFRIVKENFWCLCVLTLLFMGPSLVLGLFLQPSYPAVDFSSVGSMEYWNGWFQDYIMESGTPTSLAAMLITLLVSYLQIAVAFVGSVLVSAAAVFLVDDIRRKRKPDVGVLVRRAFGRFWPLLGSALLCYVVLIFAWYIACVILLSMIFVLSMAIGDLGFSLILVILITLGAAGVLVYFLTRLAFGPAATAMAPVAPGISQSWKLTRGNMWRALGVLVVSAVIVYCVTSIFEVAFFFLGILGAILSIPFQVVATMVSSTTLAVLFFDLEARNNAGDMKAMVDHLEAEEWWEMQHHRRIS